MNEERLYVPVVENDALDLAEDITKITMAKHCIDKISTCELSKDDKWQVLNILNEWERKCRAVLRYEYLYAEHKAKPISESLRQRLKLELINEGVCYEPGEDQRNRKDSTSFDKGATSDEGRKGWEEPPF